MPTRRDRNEADSPVDAPEFFYVRCEQLSLTIVLCRALGAGYSRRLAWSWVDRSKFNFYKE
jgi:hypothetical protein